MILWMNVFTLSVRLACDSQRHERLLRVRYWFTSNHIPFRFGCRPWEAKTLEAEAKTHEAEATTHKAEFFGLETARPRGLTSLTQSRGWLGVGLLECGGGWGSRSTGRILARVCKWHETDWFATWIMDSVQKYMQISYRGKGLTLLSVEEIDVFKINDDGSSFLGLTGWTLVHGLTHPVSDLLLLWRSNIDPPSSSLCISL